jgi:hypothetical protein
MYPMPWINGLDLGTLQFYTWLDKGRFCASKKWRMDAYEESP